MINMNKEILKISKEWYLSNAEVSDNMEAIFFGMATFWKKQKDMTNYRQALKDARACRLSAQTSINRASEVEGKLYA